MKRISKVLFVIGLLVLFISFITKGYSETRIIELLLGLLLLQISFIYKSKRKLISLIIYPLVWLVFLFFIDFECVYFIKYKPILARKIVSSENFITYNSLFYREFECNNKTYIDIFYKKSNYCPSKNLEEKDINSLSSDIINSFKDYKNKFFLFNAKVSYKEGNNKIELKSYNNDENNINGNVIFNDNIIYKLEFNNLNNIDDLKVYDSIKVVGRIDSLKKNNEIYIITIKDAYIPNLKLYNNYQINIVENKGCQKDKANYVETKNNKYYTSCLSNIYIVYNDDEVYELSYALKDEKITLDNLLTGYDNIEEQKIEDNEYKLYQYDKYNILVCDEVNIIIGNKNLDFNNNYCSVKDVDQNDL